MGVTRRTAVTVSTCVYGLYLGKQTLDEQIRANKNSEQMRRKEYNLRVLERKIFEDAEECHLPD